MYNTQTILIVDDEPRTRGGLKNMLEAWSAGRYTIKTAENGKDARQLIEQEPVHLLITDIRMPEITGLNLVEWLGSLYLSVKPTVILISGYAEFEYAQQGLQLGVVNYLLKPISKSKLIAATEQALEIASEQSRIQKMQRIVDEKLIHVTKESEALSDPVKAAIGYVEKHLDQAFSLREVADHVHLNPSYFCVLFKDQMQMTFLEYVTRSRMQKAKELLLQTKLPISEIAERVGYQTTKYFSKLFKEYEGHSPGIYRNETLGHNEEV